MKLNGWIVTGLIFAAAFGISACFENSKGVAEIIGVYDGFSYTSPSGLYSIELKDWAVMKNVKDKSENEGASLTLDFQDKAKNEYHLMATFVREDLDAHAMFEGMAKQAVAEGKNAGLSATADGDECVVVKSFLKEGAKREGVGLINVVFYRKGVIFDFTIQTAPHADPEQAGKGMETAFAELWSRGMFRGRVDRSEEYPEGTDPRVTVAAAAAAQIGKAMGYEVELIPRRKAIIRVIGKGTEGDLTLSLGIAATKTELSTTEAVAGKANDLVLLKDMKEKFYARFSEALVMEKLTVTRTDAFDVDLSMLPTKETK